MLDQELNELKHDLQTKARAVASDKNRARISKEGTLPLSLRTHIEDDFKPTPRTGVLVDDDNCNLKRETTSKTSNFKKASVEDADEEDEHDEWIRDAATAPKTNDIDPRRHRSNADRTNHSESEASTAPFETDDEEDEANEMEDDDTPEGVSKKDLEAFLDMLNSWFEEDQKRSKKQDLADSFDYENPIYQASIEQLETIILNDIRKSGGGIARRQYRRLQTFLEMSTTNGRPKDERAASDLLYAATYFKGVNYDCCINSCLSYMMYPKFKHCPTCGEARYRKDGKPRAQYRVFPLEHRLRLMQSRPERARLMREYRAGAEAVLKKEGILTDYWNGKIHEIKRDLYKDPSDMALLLSTDGTKAFKVCCPFAAIYISRSS